MKSNIVLFYVLAGVFFLSAAIYTLWSMNESGAAYVGTAPVAGHPEWIGTVTLTLSGVLAVFIAVYLTLTNRSIGGVLPEDREDALIDDGDSELGHYSPWSWWPFTLGIGVALVFLGLAIGVWIALIGAPIVLIAVIGWNLEYYRGNFAR